MNEQNAKMMEAAQRIIEARDADTRADERRKYEADIGPDLQIIYAALERINNRIFGTLVVPGAVKRKRAKSVANESLVLDVRGMFENLPEGDLLMVGQIDKQLNCGPRRAADACQQLIAQGYIKERQGGGYQWIPEKEAEQENGLRTGLDDGPDIEQGDV